MQTLIPNRPQQNYKMLTYSLSMTMIDLYMQTGTENKNPRCYSNPKHLEIL